MKSLVAILLGIAITFGVFGSVMPSMDPTLHETMTANEQASMSQACGSGVCTTLPAPPANCSTLCFIASGFTIDTGVLPGSSLTLLVLALAAILALHFNAQTKHSRFAFNPIGYRDSRLILTTHKRE